MIPVTKPHLPEREVLNRYIDRIYATEQLTNNGPLLQELERRLEDYLGIEPGHLVLVANGSLALHLAFKALGLEGEVITTPFSFIATASTLAWEGLVPVFCDIDSSTFNLDPDLIEDHISSRTSAIVPVHVFGNPCEVDRIESIAYKNDLKIIYDASHCFGAELNGESILNFGDVSTISFHATKLFHTVEGGAVVAKDKAIADKVRSMINFGISGPDQISLLGTNAKMSEFHAAMGLAVLDEIELVKRERGRVWRQYESQIKPNSQLQERHALANNNYAYFPVVFKDQMATLACMDALKMQGIYAKRYFYPSLNLVPYMRIDCCAEVSENLSQRILCLPIYSSLSAENVDKITDVILSTITK